ncbi:MAG: transporter [Campylobacterota bacterium]|nr:transporter [Campylobacterota bacterium]
MYKKILINSVLFTTALSAQNIIPLANINGNVGNGLKEGILKIALSHESCTKDSAYHGSNKVIDPKQRIMDVNINKLKLRYGLGNGFDVRAIFTHKDKTFTYLHPMSSARYKNTNKGLGDTLVIGRYEILNQKKGDSVFLSVGAGVKLPTGSTSKTFNSPAGDTKFPIMQLGSGSTDYLAEVGISRFLPNSRIDAHMIYTQTTKGDNNYQFGDKLKWNIGYSYAINNALDVQLELDGSHCKKHKSSGIEVDSTGGTFTYITPGIHYKINKQYNIGAGYAYLLKRDNNFDTASNTGGLSETGKLIFQLVMTF